MNRPHAPIDRSGFYTAILCASPLEGDAVTLIFDEIWHERRHRYGRADKDTNTYITGCIGLHNVVLVISPISGTVTAASSTANLKSSFNNIELVLVVGICGGMPKVAGREAYLGDTIISTAIIQYDYGRKYHGMFEVYKRVEDTLSNANKDIQTMLNNLRLNYTKRQVVDEATDYLHELQEKAVRDRFEVTYTYPEDTPDQLFAPNFIHKHHTECPSCESPLDSACDTAKASSCDELQCNQQGNVQRIRDLPREFRPSIFLGRIGSGNTLMKSGEDRDRIAKEHNLIAFEMEGAGAWDELPCIVVKGMSDYADSHKNDLWQNFAAATAACVAKAILGHRPVSDRARFPFQPGGYGPPSGRNIFNNSFGNNARINQGDMMGEDASRIFGLLPHTGTPGPFCKYGGTLVN